MKYKPKLISVFFLVLIIPTILYVILLLLLSNEKDRIQLIQNDIRRIVSNADQQISLVKGALQFMTSDVSIRNYYSILPEDEQVNNQIEELYNLRKRLLSFESISLVAGVRLFVPETKFYISERNQFFPYSELNDLPMFKNADGQVRMTGIYTIKQIGCKKAEVISFYQQIMHIDYILQPVALGVMDISLDNLQHFFKENFQDSVNNFWLLRQYDGENLINTTTKSPDFTMQELAFYSREHTIAEKNNRHYIICRMENSGLLLVADTYRGIFPFLTSNPTTNRFFILILALIFLFFFSTMLISLMFAKKISQLLTCIIENKAYSSRGLYYSLDQAVDEIRLMISKREEAIRQQEQASLRLLQAQINPHFLYNALDAVRWMINKEEKEKAEQTIIVLSRYFRLALSKGNDIITLQNELELTRFYVHIQLCRMNFSFDIDYTVNPQTLSCLLPKMSLQPIVENAIIHGFDCVNNGRIFVTSELTENGNLMITVTNTGKKIDVEKVQHILSGEETVSGFGLYNVHQRIRLFSGSDEYGVFLESEEDSYTAFTLLIRQPSSEDSSQREG